MCWDEAAEDAAWAQASKMARLPGLPDRLQDHPPPLPWITATPFWLAAIDPDVIDLLGDLERCLAWTLITEA